MSYFSATRNKFCTRISHPMYNTLNASLYPFERVIIKSVDNLQNLSSESTYLILQLMIRNQIFT